MCLSVLLPEAILMSKHCPELTLPLACCRRAGPAPCWPPYSRVDPTPSPVVGVSALLFALEKSGTAPHLDNMGELALVVWVQESWPRPYWLWNLEELAPPLTFHEVTQAGRDFSMTTITNPTSWVSWPEGRKAREQTLPLDGYSILESSPIPHLDSSVELTLVGTGELVS